MMLIINENQTNELTVTLCELAVDTLPLDNWLFVFVKDEGEDEYKIFLTDISPNKPRYNLFELIEGTDVDFQRAGDYGYKVYQMPDQNDTDESRGHLVEEGKARVKFIEEETKSFKINTKAKVYERS